MSDFDVPLDSSAEVAAIGTPVEFYFDNSYARLPVRFSARVDPTPVASPRLIKINDGLARSLGLDPGELTSREGVEILAGNRRAEGSEPIAMAYAGDQFGHFVPRLGDGRAKLLGEVVGRDGARYDIHLKGAGPTPFSRRGDGRAALGPVLREYILSEAMFALGVPSTRALSAVLTGQAVQRETPQPGAVFARVAASHLRVGTFQYFAAQKDIEGLRILADYAIGRHYPEAAKAERRYRALLDGVIRRQATLVAQWVLLGFVHGVMNTDNMSISGETIDYGPCAFLEAYDPAMVFSSIDSMGRYAYGNQHRAALWNLTRLAEALLPLLDAEAGGAKAGVDSANEALAGFEPQFDAVRTSGLSRKLGLTLEQEGDAALGEDLLERMAAGGADFTLTFRRLCDAAVGEEGDAAVGSLFRDPASFGAWAARWRKRLLTEPGPAAERATAMRAANPAYIPRNHLVGEALDAAVTRGDFGPFETMLEVVSLPYESRPVLERFATPATPEQTVRATFCGT